MGDMIDRDAASLAVANVEIGYHDGISGDWHPKSGPAIISAACAAIRALPAASSEDVRAGVLDPATLEAVARMFDAIGDDAPMKGYECAKAVRGLITGAKP